ncbi:MAG: hypothetical protein V4687_14245 [Bacteroidota bacterium]
MRILWFSLILGLIVLGCGQQKDKVRDYKVVRNEVILYHEQVMGSQPVVIQNQMRLDTLLKSMKVLSAKASQIDTLKEKIETQRLIQSLAEADDAMNHWMQQFEPDIEGKTNDQAVQYFIAEKAKVGKIDSLYRLQIKLSGDYLKRFQ